MQLARFLNKLFKKNGFILIDAYKKKFIIGEPKIQKPITLRILSTIGFLFSGVPIIYFFEFASIKMKPPFLNNLFKNLASCI